MKEGGGLCRVSVRGPGAGLRRLEGRPVGGDVPQNPALRRRLEGCGAVLTSARLFDKFGGGSIRVIECVLQEAEAQLLHN